MPLAHVCPNCGDQLTRTRAIRDAVYQLPIVACPCGFAAVRRRHPFSAWWRKLLRVQRALCRLIIQLLFLLLLSLGTAGFTGGIRHEARSNGMSPLQLLIAACGGAHSHDHTFRLWLIDQGGVFELIVFVLVSFIAGVWLRTGFGHWRWPRPLGAWVLLIAGLIWIQVPLWPLTWVYLKATHQATMYNGPRLQESKDLAFVLGVSLIVSMAGVGLGRLLLRLTAGSRRRLFLKRLARMRKRRHAE